MSVLVRPSVVADVNGYATVPVAGGEVVLDALAIPYGSAVMEVPLSVVPELETLDPRADTRIRVTAADDEAGTSRTFDLGLRSRTLIEGEADRAVSVELATDEALATDYSVLAPDSGARAYEGSLRGVCNYVLGKIPGLGNLIPNPGFTTDYSGFTMSASYGTLSWASTSGVGGGGALLVTITTTGSMRVDAPAVPVTPGAVLSGSFYARTIGSTPATGRPIRVRVSWLNGPGGAVSGTDIVLTGSYQRAVLEGILVPAGVTSARLELYSNASSIVGGVVADQFQLEARPTAAPFRDGVLVAAAPPGMPDKAVKAAWNLTNLVPNPSFEVDGTGSAPSVNTGTFSIVTMSSPAGAKALRITVTATGAATWFVAGNANAIRVSPGTRYRYEVKVRSDTTARAVTPYILWRDVAGTSFVSTVAGATITSSVTAWTTYTVTATAPVGAAYAWLQVGVGTSVAGQWHYSDAVSFFEDPGEAVPYFDGASPDDALYTYDWTGTAHASTSERTAIVERPLELYTWEPGTTAWDFLEPFTTSTGLRLYCDEARAWRLIDPAEYSVPGLVTLASWNVSDAADTISREDPEVFATGVVVWYEWTDPAGVFRRQYDSAGTPEKVVTLTYQRPYPGAGAAAAILARRSGSGRTQDTTALAHLPTTPGMEATIAIENAPLVRGKVSSVRFNLSDGLLMQVGTRGLIDIPADSWDAGPATVTWTNVTGTWDTFTWEAQP